eukprot:TRINITY_DN296_c0_g1_i14.p1 TRINITY_DN296_c0_g1~~TRINITY_DN296_c0_g1_i14.p1  ORF type:complete len:331 (+),score=63.74 TRINITY_DN296_c0_g1_i14:2499-3491(+)
MGLQTEVVGKRRTQIMEEVPLPEVLEKLITLITSPRSVLEEEKTGEHPQAKPFESPPETESELAQIENLSEDEMITATQKCFTEIANQINQRHQTIDELFSDVAFTKVIDGEEVILINPGDFLKVLKEKLEVSLTSIEKAFLKKVLAVSEEDDSIKLQDFMQIMEDFGISIGEEDKVELDFNELDKVSVVLMLALTEYIVASKLPLYDLFSEIIYQQDVQIEDEKVQIDLINSEDFFNTLSKIGISMEEKEHENLRNFLCIDPEYPDKLMINKLKRTIEEFAVNEELRSYAQQCYQELVEEEQPEVGEGGDDEGRDIEDNEGEESNKTLQ